MPGIRNSILDTVGNTPVVRINNIAPAGVELFVKVEAFNPPGSVKDRLALGVIEAAENGSGMLAKARELAERHGWFLCHPFENEANANVHSRTTAEEILSEFGPHGLDYWVTPTASCRSGCIHGDAAAAAEG
jgi:cysteine synthase